jgi:two-component system response regulator
VKSKFNVLLAEDNPIDLRLFHLALKRNGGRDVEIQEVGDGLEAIEYLKGEGKFADRFHHPFPHLLILDLKMPRVDGLQVIRWIRKNKHLSRLPVVMLSGSGLQKDIAEAYRLGVNSYFTKPTDFKKFEHLLGLLFDYWKMTEQPDPHEPI